MTTENRTDYLTRDSIMRLLSDDEVAAVSTAQTASHLDDGDEYVDLESLHEGVHRSRAKAAPMGHVLPKKAVGDATWLKILAKLRTGRDGTSTTAN